MEWNTMIKTKLYLAAACLLLTTSAQAYDTITVGNIEVQLLTSGEQAYSIIGQDSEDGFDIMYGRIITGESSWSEEQKNAIKRSLEVIEQSFDTGDPNRKFEVAIALNPLPYGVLGNSLGTLVIDDDHQTIYSTGELLLRDNIAVENILGSVDDTILLSPDFPFGYGAGDTSSSSYDFQAVVTHEILHALGVTSMSNSAGEFYLGLTKWASLLEDIYGNSVTHVSSTGENGTVFWTGEYANATYGGPVPIQTFIDEYRGGSSLSHPGVFANLMSWSLSRGTGERGIDKLLLDMYRDMGWTINEDYYNSFGPTYYSEAGNMINTTDFTTTHSYTYGMYVNGNGNTIVQNSSLKTTEEQSQAFKVAGHNNHISLKGTQIVESNYSQAVKIYGSGNVLQTDQENDIIAQGIESTGVYTLGYNNVILHSGSISADVGSVAIKVDNFGTSKNIPINTAVHIQSGSEIIGDIVNGDITSSADISFGRSYNDDLTYSADHDFNFAFNDEFIGSWNYDFHAGTVTLANTLTLQDATIMKGNGTIVGNVDSNGLIAPGNSVGVLTINGDLTQTPTSNLEIEFGEEGVDQLNVTGTVNLDGALTFVPIGYLTPGTYQFLTAGTVNGGFISVNNFTSAVLETSTSGVSPESFTLTRNSYQSLSGNSFTASLDEARLTATGDIAEVLNQIDLMSLGDFISATTDLSPHIYNSITTTSLDAIQTRSSFLRSKINPEAVNNGSPLWFSGYNGKTQYNQKTTSNAFAANQTGFMLGGNTKNTTGFNLGGAVSIVDFDVDEDHTASKSNGSVYSAYLYGSWRPQTAQSFNILTVLGAGFSDYDTEREITFLNRTAQGDQTANHYSAFIGCSYNYTTDNWSIEPSIGIEYVYLNEDNFNESGAGDLSLNIDDKESDALTSSVGINISHQYHLQNSIIVPNINAAWLHNFSPSTDKTTGTLQSGESFHVNGRDASEDALELGLGFRIIANEQFSSYIDYQYTFADDQDSSHFVSAGLRYNF